MGVCFTTAMRLAADNEYKRVTNFSVLLEHLGCNIAGRTRTFHERTSVQSPKAANMTGAACIFARRRRLVDAVDNGRPPAAVRGLDGRRSHGSTARLHRKKQVRNMSRYKGGSTPIRYRKLFGQFYMSDAPCRRQPA